MDIIETLQKKILSIPVQQFVSDYIHEDRLEFNPPYQRRYVWTKVMSRKLITSILNDFPIGSIHLVEPENEMGIFDILDAKQRVKAIKDFISGDLEIDVGNNKGIRYKNLKEISPKAWSKFREYQLQIVKYEHIGYDMQSKVFDVINTATPISNQERYLSQAFCAGKMYQFILDKHLHQIHNFSKLASDKRMRDIKWVQQILYPVAGKDLQEETRFSRIPDIKKLTLKQSADVIHKKIIQITEVDESCRKDMLKDDFGSIIKKLGFDKKLKRLKEYSGITADLLQYKTPQKSGSINPWTLVYFLTFLMEKDADEILTPSLVVEHKEKFSEFFRMYWKTASNKKLNAKHATKSVFEEHQKILDSGLLSLGNSGVDLGKKTRNIPTELKALVKAESDGFCPSCKCKLRIDNTQIDHINPHSKSSKTELVATCDRCNNSKSNISALQVDKIKALHDRTV